MADYESHLDLLPTGLAQPEVPANSLFNAMSPASLFGRQDYASASLTWGYYGGVMMIAGVPTTIANGTITLTASATNYVEATTAGVVSANTSDFTDGEIPLYVVTTNTTGPTDWDDKRPSALGMAGSTTGGGGGGIGVEDEGSSIVAAATALNFVGAGVTVTDAGSNEATVTIAGGGGGGGADFGNLYGPGLDGSATLAGGAGGAPSWITIAPLNSVYYWELNRNVSLVDLTINSGVKVYTRAFAIWINGTLTNNGLLGAPGGSGGGSTGLEGGRGGGVTGQYLGVGEAGGSGQSTSGSNGTSAGTDAIGGRGGSGGNGSGGVGGTAGFLNAPTDTLGGLHAALTTRSVIEHGRRGASLYHGGSGGGGGAGGTGIGGQGGGGGGVSYIAARNIAGSGTISCAGGAGQDSTAVNGGGGGGGGGGFLIVVTETDDYQSVNTVTVAGGAGGAPTGSGTAGATATAGRLLDLITTS